MRDYGSVHTRFWSNPDMQALSDQAKLLALYLITGPHTNMLGCFRLPNGYVAEDLNWSTETVSKRFTELFQKGFVTRDEATGWVFIPRVLEWNPIENPNQAKSLYKLFEQAPEKSLIYPHLVAVLLTHSKYFEERFLNRLESLSKGFSQPFRNQYQDQKQNQDQDIKKEKQAKEKSLAEEKNIIEKNCTDENLKHDNLNLITQIVVLEGRVVLSIEGRRVMELGPGEVFGVQAWLDHMEHRHMLSVVSLEPLSYLEVNPAALALASDEVVERFRRQISTVVVRRLAAVSRQLAEHAPAAVRAQRAAPASFDMKLLDR